MVARSSGLLLTEYFDRHLARPLQLGRYHTNLMPSGEAYAGGGLRLTGRDTDMNLRASEKPEFDAWRWNDYWIPLDSVIEFKREVYRKALLELERFLHARARTHRDRLYGGLALPDVPPSYAEPLAGVGE